MTEKTEIYNGGPAFPLDLHVGEEHRWGHGMTLRDYFAATAMNKLLGNSKDQNIDEISDMSYKVADSMINRRNT